MGELWGMREEWGKGEGQVNNANGGSDVEKMGKIVRNGERGETCY